MLCFVFRVQSSRFLNVKMSFLDTALNKALHTFIDHAVKIEAPEDTALKELKEEMRREAQENLDNIDELLGNKCPINQRFEQQDAIYRAQAKAKFQRIS